MDGTQTFNINRECIKPVDQWGQTIYYNICNGDSVVVPWGIMHYAFFPLLVVVLAAITFIVAKVRVEHE